MVNDKLITVKQIWELLDTVPDPEIPVISIVDLGVIRKVNIDNDEVKIIITPTYTGCPASAVIQEEIRQVLTKEGIEKLSIETKIMPAWTTDWLSGKGRMRLEEYGIAPPSQTQGPQHCPLCKSKTVEKVSQFGSTPCKAQWRCLDCLEPFDYFKCI